MAKRYSVIAHRGAKAKELENTIKAIDRAIDDRADLVEMDVMMTWDSEFIIFHDFILDRLTNWSGLVNTKTLKTIRDIKLKNGEKIPTLDEVLSFIVKKKKQKKGKLKTKLILDLKDLTGLFKYNKMIDKIKSYKLENDIILFSMNYHLIKRIAREYDDFSYCYFSWLPNLKALNRAKKINAEYVGSAILTKSFIRKAHRKGLKVVSFGTKNKRKLAWFLKNDVDFITSDCPETLRRMIKYHLEKEKELKNKGKKFVHWVQEKIHGLR